MALMESSCYFRYYSTVLYSKTSLQKFQGKQHQIGQEKPVGKKGLILTHRHNKYNKQEERYSKLEWPVRTSSSETLSYSKLDVDLLSATAAAARINDHKRQYLRRLASPDAPDNEELPNPAEDQLAGNPPARSSPPVESPPALPIQLRPHSPASSLGDPDE
ncbi:hypothetical protein BDV93DRAFT_505392 [Ceratobasidium sp. AG-I]|nr:hypothetical protein BDV93DRAFT_505392 [Ceratobasidium sp. AG-I]